VHSIYNANVFRSDLQSAGTGTGKYGFNIPLPVNLRDGKPHQLSVRVQGTTYVLSGSPRTLTCSVPSQYYGSVNALDCSTVQGWVWDKSYPDSSLTIELYEGSTVHATVVANAYRADVKSAGYGTGNYGFSFALPSALKDGQSHQLSVRVKNSSYTLNNSPKTVTCATTARIAAPDGPSQEVEKVFSGAGEQPELDIDLVIFPNPTRGKINASYSLSENVNAELTITNIVGLRVWRQLVKGTGERVEMPYDFNQLADGVYIMKLATSDQKVEVRRIVLTR
ncbi:T9SS type A sorting domain-containing protein, partial [Dyadobacter sp. CY326]|uniref:T9SS type A sorting domain-containing protein n=1 Tax=Dyadobacter sp. CY326 TaxID=2907300 RepID=UPI001F412C87